MAVSLDEGKNPSPGRPSTAQHKASSSFLDAIAQGLSSENAASERASLSVERVCSANAAGMPPIDLNPPSAVSCPFLSGKDKPSSGARNLEVRAIFP